MQVEAALDSWRDWDSRLNNRPVILRPLEGGRSNRSFLLDSDIGKLVLRLNGQNSLLPGETRNHETKIWQAASQAGIAPSLLFSDEKAGFLVNRYIDNGLTTNPVANRALGLQALNLLIRCHQLQVKAPTIDYGNHIEHYWSVIENQNTAINPTLTAQREPMRLVLETLLNSGTAIGLCHHDPVVANFVGSSEHLYLIDWEYAAIGLQVMDYAAIGIEWEIDDAELVSQTGIELNLLLMAKTLFGYICDLWEEQMGPGSSPG